jgi:hypothetical protein
VDEYVKPTFYAEVTGESETVRPGEKIKAKLKARRFAGGAPAGTVWLNWLISIANHVPIDSLRIPVTSDTLPGLN